MKNSLLIIGLVLVSCNTKQGNNTLDDEKKQLDTIKTEVLLVGTSHWNNYKKAGFDVTQTNEIDILSATYQKDLNDIANKIAAFKPDKIFVERTLDYQPKLDSLLNLYKTTKWGTDKRNEIYQLGFRVAKTLKQDRVYGIDFRNTQFPYDSLMKAMELAKQTTLISSFNADIKHYESNYNTLVSEQRSLKDILYFLNDDKQRQLDLSWYLEGANKGGDLNSTVGSFLASEWIKRNIYSYGLIQKYTQSKDNRIMILMGASHIAVLKQLISVNTEWKTVELKAIME
ncbi:DUF5694 domain-containing protein [Psychroserpens sp. NJDZ02]|uniref:DUF5694 domain-containing protein n=1 Tax=Psychroserpens sp. NJDZ02 TaxID=2570561 RepID=UPI0010A77AA6|nr:DUF5694 domain-containing protein [Psychroserpens sp. NJDZ02]QCE42977.1 hypothetical protein E9099_16665 [Psychroserpens sp. NJDZ02]